MPKIRLDKLMVQNGLVQSRSQAENLIRLGKVSASGNKITKPGYLVEDIAQVEFDENDKYVSRAALKLASAAKKFNINFKETIVLDVGSSTGGFTDFALKNGAEKVIAVDVGTNQMHPSLLSDKRIELHEKTDIRDFEYEDNPDFVMIDASFISMREILPAVAKLSTKQTQIIAMLKPQFEAGVGAKHKGIIKNSRMRKQIISDFESWVKKQFVIKNSIDSSVAGAKGNVERFYLLQKRDKH